MFKRCFKCLCELPLSAFYKHAQMGDGHLNKCKTCTKKDVTEHRQSNLERLRQYDRMRSSQPHRVALRKRTAAEWIAKHPDRRAAQMKLAHAVRSGAIKRWPCEVCGEKAEAHHPHYGEPLLVTWLCRPHHAQAHALLKKAA
jgi:hypothetical protein